MSDCWENITEGMKVEVINRDCHSANTVYWIATVIKVAGGWVGARQIIYL